MMNFFFQRHFCRRQKRQKHPAAARQPGPGVPASKARRRSSVGLPSVALIQSRRSSVGLPPVHTDQCRRPSVGLLVASGQRRQSVIESGSTSTTEATEESGRGAERADVALKRGRREFHYKPYHAHGASGPVACKHRGPEVRYRCPSKVKSIEPHLLGSSMLLASVVQMGKRVLEKEKKETDVSPCSCSESDDEKESDDEEVENRSEGIKCRFPLTQPKITTRPLVRPPRCLRRNSSHVFKADTVLQSSETCSGLFGRYSHQRSSQDHWALNKPIQTSTTSPSLGQLASSGLRSEPEGAETDVLSSGSVLHKSCSSPLGAPEGTMYYDPYLDTWENFLSYVTHTHIHTLTHTHTQDNVVCLNVY